MIELEDAVMEIIVNAGQQLFTGTFFAGPVAYVHGTSLSCLVSAGYQALHTHRVS